MNTPDERLPEIDDPALDGGEWLFRRGGDVFGPVDSRTLAGLLYRGELESGTPVSTGDGAWRPVGEVPLFLVHARKAEAALRVEREVTGARQLRARRSRNKGVALGVAALLLVALAVGGAFLLAGRGAGTSALLEDFGAGVRIASAARVGTSQREADEVEVTIDPAVSGGGSRPGPARRTAGGRYTGAGAGAGAADPARPGEPAPGGSVEGGALVAAQWNEGRIQAVVAREQRSLVPCFREEALRSPEFRGDVPIAFAIGNDGRVAALWVDQPLFRDGPLKECLTRTLATWRFDPFPGQRPTVTLAFGIGR